MGQRTKAAIVSFAVAVAGALVGFGVSGSNATAATAAPPAVATTTSADPGTAAVAAEAWFEPSGDRLVVCDRAPDGYGAFAQLYWSGFIGRSNRADGDGDCSYATGNIGEGPNVVVSVRVCLVQAGAVSSCGGWVDYVNNG